MSTTPDYAGLLERLSQTAAERRTATAVDKDRHLNVVARLSREDGALMYEASAAVRTLLSNYKTAQANWELALESNAALERERDEQWKRADTLAQQNAYYKDRAGGAEAERDRLAERVAELAQKLADAYKFHGPYGWLNGNRGLSEDSWNLEGDPLENNDEYFSIPLYALVDPFEETRAARSLVNGEAEPKFIVDDNGNTGWVIP